MEIPPYDYKAKIVSHDFLMYYQQFLYFSMSLYATRTLEKKIAYL